MLLGCPFSQGILVTGEVAGDMPYKGYHSYSSCLSPIHSLAAMRRAASTTHPCRHLPCCHSPIATAHGDLRNHVPRNGILLRSWLSPTILHCENAHQHSRKCIRKRVWGRLNPCFLSYFFLYMFIFMTDKATEMNIIRILGLESFVYSFLSQLWMTIILHQ